MATDPNAWVYGDYAPDPQARDLVGLKARWIVNQLPAAPAPRVLDYGAGEGKHLHLVRKSRPAAALVGVDIRPVRTKVDFSFHQVAPDAPLPFPDNCFDVIVSCDVLEHVNNIERSLDQILRVLRPRGAFIGFVPMEGGVTPHALFRLFDRNVYRDTKDHVHAYQRGQMLQWFSSRFRIVDLAYSYHWIGSTLDATFFASFKWPVIGPRVESFWRGQENIFYRGEAGATSPSFIGRMAKLGNSMAYWESRLLHRVPFGATGLHFHLEKP